MDIRLRSLAWLAAVAFTAASCGGSSPAAPSAAASTPTTPTPAVQLALTGTWLLGTTPTLAITQTGKTITGTQIYAPIISSGVIITISGSITGTLSDTTSGSTLTLSLPTKTVTVGTGPLAGPVISCSSTDSWVGQATNTTLTGSYTAGTMTCDGAGIGAAIDTKVTGTQIYTKQ